MNKVYRVHDSLGVKRTADDDAYKHVSPTKPTRENIENFFRNALFSSGSRAEAISKTKKMFDLTSLDVSETGTVASFKVADETPESLSPAEINRKNRQFWEPDKSGTADHDPPTEPPTGNSGNVSYVLTLPPGDYSAEDGGDVMKILRLGSDGDGKEPELVATVPAGTYRLEEAKTGHQHLFRLPDGAVPERQPLSDSPVRVGDHMPAALRRMNERMRAFYSQPVLRRRAGA